MSVNSFTSNVFLTKIHTPLPSYDEKQLKPGIEKIGWMDKFFGNVSFIAIMSTVMFHL